MFEVLVATVILQDDKVLMVREKDGKAKGLLNFPAGHLERGETLTEGAIREVKEETGFDVKIVSHIDTRYFSRGEKYYVAFVFKGEIEQRAEALSELECGFYEIDYLKNNPNVLRNESLILDALAKMTKQSTNQIDVFN